MFTSRERRVSVAVRRRCLPFSERIGVKLFLASRPSATSYYKDNGALWVKLVSSGDVLGTGPGSGPGGGASLQVSRGASLQASR